MDGIFTQSRLKIVFFSRLFYYLLTLLCTYESEPYDTSNLLYNKEKFGSLSYLILRFLNHLSNWDGVHFLAIAKSGYLYEQQHAFLPLFPLIIRSVAKCIWPFAFWFLSYDAILHISGFIIRNVLFFSSSFMLLSLTNLIFQPKSFILTEVLVLYCINPSTVFNISIYTENLYSTLLFTSLYFFFKYQADNLNSSFYISLILFSLNCFTRSNSTMLCVFVICFYFITSPVPSVFNAIYNGLSSILRLNPINHSFNKRYFIVHLIKMIIICIIIISPFLLYQCYYQYYYCNILNYDDKLYCDNIYIPTFYQYIQNKYWDCGFMKYYTISHIPGVLLALPIIILSLMTLNSIDIHIVRWSFRIPSISEYIIPFKLHLIGLLLLGLTIAHVQIMTRLITSSTPLIYWYVAFLPHSMKKLIIVIYFFVYSVVGCILFTSFYPWT